MTIKFIDNLIIGATEWQTSPFKFNVTQLNFTSGDTPTPPTPATALLGRLKTSSIPLNDNNLHLLDGSLLTYADYPDFINYVAELYEEDPTASYFANSFALDNYNIVGTLTDNDGVLSGFSSQNYVTIPGSFAPGYNTWEMIIKFNISRSDLAYPTIIEGDAGSGRVFDIFVRINKMLATVVADGGGVILDQSGTTTIQPNTWYWMKYAYTGSQHILYLSTTGAFNGEETTEFTVTDSRICVQNMAFKMGAGELYPFEGSIDMNDCSIAIGDDIWWKARIIADNPEQAWQAEVSKYGVCGKFAYDSVNNTVRLPKYGSQITTNGSNAINSYYYIEVKGA